jgi:hypothetical protein
MPASATSSDARSSLANSHHSSNAVSDSRDLYDAKALARELMMPTGEPAAAVIGACLLLGMIWFFASGHFNGGAPASISPSSLNASGSPVPPPALHRSAG